MQAHAGQCHCGALAFLYRTALPVETWAIRACDCSFCRLHAVLSTSDPAGLLEFRVVRADALQRYRFGLRTADFLLCTQCGVYVGAQIETARGIFGIINARGLRTVSAGLPAASRVSYEGEDAGQRLARRERRWTPLARTV